MRRALLLLSWLLVLACGCGNPTHPCGTFSFSGTPSGNAENIQTTFAFDPSKCGSSCVCNTINFIQIVRITDRETGDFLAPNSQQAARIVTGQSPTSNGWAVDQLATPVVWGWYGYDSGAAGGNHEVNDPAYVTEGSNTSSAILFDVPSGWSANTWFEAVDVPVCLDKDSKCVDYLLGYYYWLFVVRTDGTVGAPFSEVGVDWMQDSLDAAVAQWNANAAGLGTHPFPTLTRM